MKMKLLSHVVPIVAAYTIATAGPEIEPGLQYNFSVSSYDADGFQWSKDGINVTGETGPTYKFQTNDAGSYTVSCLVTWNAVVAEPAPAIPADLYIRGAFELNDGTFTHDGNVVVHAAPPNARPSFLIKGGTLTHTNGTILIDRGTLVLDNDLATVSMDDFDVSADGMISCQGANVETLSCVTSTLSSGAEVDMTSCTAGTGTYTLIDASTSLTDNGVALTAGSVSAGWSIAVVTNQLRVTKS